ncbi:MAG TPA: transglycosylase SLT domain-containing protein, partial [Reyranella sp.]|nr:transglycosylase SLT domain-containing protein [Reyranella sp.]
MACFCSWGISSGRSDDFTKGDFPRAYDPLIRAEVARHWPDFPHWIWWKAQLWQESRLDTKAVSPVGAAGLCQAMPATFADWVRKYGWQNASPHVAKHCIAGGAGYMYELRQVWKQHATRTPLERHLLGLAQYNAGTGNILAAQKACGDARLWSGIAPCLPSITGKRNAKETTDYVRLIPIWAKKMEAAEALRAPVALVVVRCSWTGHRGGCGP